MLRRKWKWWVAALIFAIVAAGVLLLIIAPEGSNCFIASTPILTSRGYVPIGRLTLDDRLVFYSHELGALVQTGIASVSSHRVGELLEVTLADGTSLRVTEEHPFYDLNAARYKPIGHMPVGAELARVSQDGLLTGVAIESIAELPGKVTVYKIEIAAPEHNYFAAGTLVHNKTVVSERATVQTAMDSMMAEMRIPSVAPSLVSTNDWGANPTGAGTAPLAGGYLRVTSTTYFYCWEANGLITRRDTAAAPCR